MNGRMWVENQWFPPTQRFRDQSLMKAFSNIPGITIGKLDKDDHCRLYMKCIKISDLANERGMLIPCNRMNGEWCAASALYWPQLQRPPAKQWKVFRWCIRRAFSNICRPSILKQPVCLDRPLGPCQSVERHIQYQYYHNNDEAFNCNGDQFL